MKEMLVILFSAILVDNFVLSKFMGICPFLGVSKKLDSAIGRHERGGYVRYGDGDGDDLPDLSVSFSAEPSGIFEYDGLYFGDRSICAVG